MKIGGYCLLFTLLLLTGVRAQNKAAYDLHPDEIAIQQETSAQQEETQQNVFRKTAAGPLERTALYNAISSATLLRGGYFTFGTTGGASAERHDDNCQITFGHPYALTSFAMLYWDGTWYRADQFFNESERELSGFRDTILLVMERPGLLRFELSIEQNPVTGALRLALLLRNLDAAPHEAALALQMDPALGRWGDAALFTDNTVILHDTTFTAAAMPTSLLLQERAHRVHGGLRAQINFPGAAPEMLRVENWQPALGTVFDPREPRPRQLFDIVLHPSWSVQTLDPAGECAAVLALELPQPDFATMTFMRWDMPTALTIDKGVLFPRDFPVMVETYNNGPNALSNTGLQIPVDGTVHGTKAAWTLNAAAFDYGYNSLSFHSEELYEEAVVPVTMYCVSGGETLDSLVRYVYIPAVPISDTGLAMQIDTVDTGGLPEVAVFFSVMDEATQVPVTAMRAEHVRLFENGERIRDFTLGKEGRSEVNAVDIVFVLDVTGSMSDEIASVRDNIQSFADDLTGMGISYRLGMVTFGDEIRKTYAFTSDAQQFRQSVGQQSASGGDDRAENSLDALFAAAQFEFRPAAHRLIIWITDADYHESDNVTQRTVPEVLAALLGNAIRVHAIGSKFDKSDYDRIIGPTGGMYFDINGNFKDILEEISRFDVSTTYALRYTTPHPSASSRLVELEVHYAGKGGTGSWMIQAPPGLTAQAEVLCYPNPFNPAVNIHVRNAAEGRGWLSVVDASGREVQRFTVEGGRSDYQFVWDADQRAGYVPASGVYFIHLQLAQPGGTLLRKTTSVVYSK
ncbi:MAG: VWA domain-containing protein [Bacteroidetes bacterium]|nr:VWA domain-containing protein [Bacteroidota bacterium]